MPPQILEDEFMKSLFDDLDESTFGDEPSPDRPKPRPAPAPVERRAIPPSFWDPPTSASATAARERERGRGKFYPVLAFAPKSTNSPRSKKTEYLPIAVVPEGKENPVTPTKEKGKEKGKGRVEEDYSALLEGIDFDEVMSSPVVERKEKKEVPHGQRYTRCLVLHVGVRQGPNGRMEKVLDVHVETIDGRNLEEESGGTKEVILRDDWYDTPVSSGSIVHLIPSPSFPLTLSFSSSTTLILHPDILLSCTKIADSTHCARKAILQEIIRTTGPGNEIMVLGNMIHELLQTSLMGEKKEMGQLVEGNLESLWMMEVGREKAMMMLEERSRGVAELLNKFVRPSPGSDAYLKDESSTLALTSTLNIEEDIWSPKWGMKGKVDVSVVAVIRSGAGEGQEMGIRPLEIKTGRSAANEHRAQTMLYTLLMEDRYNEKIDAGLLLYTTSSEIVRVRAREKELGALVRMRNGLADVLDRRMSLRYEDEKEEEGDNAEKEEEGDDAEKEEEGDDAEKEYGFDAVAEEVERELPLPIDDERSCRRCYVADACMLYRKAVDLDPCISHDDSDPLQIFFEDKTGHLTKDHLEFFRTWERLISLEEQELVRFKKEIWTMGAEERMKFGRCLADMKIDESFDDPVYNEKATKIHRFTYRLQHSAPLSTQPTSSQRASQLRLHGTISVNDPIVISLETPVVLAISRGFVLELTPQDIVVGLDQSLTDNIQARRMGIKSWDLVFRIDKDELAAGMGRVRDNLIQLFVVGGDERRRQLVVDLERPEFLKVDHHRQLLSPNLNQDQVRAVEKVLAARDYALILGMPGTGKTTTIVEVLKALARAGKSVLLTSYTHSAVDNILLKMEGSGLNILRLGNRDKVVPALHHLTPDPENKATTLEQLDHQFMTPQIVATTCLGINEPLFSKRKFDVCIVDEASQVTLPTCLGPLRFAKTFVLVGDHHQLPPLVRNQGARKGGLDVSLFKRLSEAHPESLIYLTQQYRMNDDIMVLSNKLIYSNRLQVGSAEVANQRLKLAEPTGLEMLHKEARMEVHHSPCWIEDLVDPNRTVVFVDTDLLPARERKIGSLFENQIEARLIVQLTEAFVKCGVAETDIGIIALYRQQIKVISLGLAHLPQVEVLTADRSQGRDKECVLMSLTRSNTEGQVGDLLGDWRRVNVCLTRAKSKLIVFGSRSTLQNNPIMTQFFDIVQARDWIYKLPPGAQDLHGIEQTTPVMARKRKADGELPMKKARIGPAARFTLSQPLARDIVNFLE